MTTLLTLAPKYLLRLTLGSASMLMAMMLPAQLRLPQPSAERSTATTTYYDTPAQATYYIWEMQTTVPYWRVVKQHTYTYSTTGKKTSEIVLSRTPTGGWQNYSQVFWEANAQDLDTNVRYYNPGGTGWVLAGRNEIHYDPYGNITINWNISNLQSGQFDTTGYKMDYVYYNTSLIDSAWMSGWMPGAGWRLQRLHANHYTVPTEWDEHAEYDLVQGNWQPSNRELDVTWYDFAQGLPSSKVVQGHTINGAFINDKRMTYQYFPNGNTDVHIENWNVNTWRLQQWQHRECDSWGQDTLYQEYWYSINSWTLTGANRMVHTYNTQGNTLQTIRQVWSQNTPVYTNYDRWDYLTTLPTSTVMAATMEVQAYPNPVTDVLHFTVGLPDDAPAEVALYDMQGRLRAQTRTVIQNADITMPIAQPLENGTYTYRLLTDKGNATGKVVVQR